MTADQLPADDSKAINLTQLAERLPRPDGPPQTVRLLQTGASGMVFDVLARDGSQEWPEEPRGNHAIYVVIAGEGALCCGGDIVECAEGDVLFAPGGVSRHFERLSRGFATWRICSPHLTPLPLPPGEGRGEGRAGARRSPTFSAAAAGRNTRSR